MHSDRWLEDGSLHCWLGRGVSTATAMAVGDSSLWGRALPSTKRILFPDCVAVQWLCLSCGLRGKGLNLMNEAGRGGLMEQPEWVHKVRRTMHRSGVDDAGRESEHVHRETPLWAGGTKPPALPNFI